MFGAPRVKMIAAVCMMAVLAAAAAPESPVADAAMRNDAATVRALVKQGADVNAAQGDGMTALHWAAQNRQADLAQLLVTAGASVDAVTRNGAYTPLHFASRSGDAATIRILLKAGSSPKAATTTGGATALHFAAGSGSADAVKALLEGGADVDVREGSAEQTPLMWAAARNYVDVVKLLLQHKADVALATRVVDYPTVEAVDDLARKKRNEVLKAFKAAAGDPEDWRPTPSQVQAAVKAAQQVQLEAQNVKADENAPARTEEGFAGYTQMVGKMGGMTALLHATREGNVETVMTLLDAGADLNQRSADNTSPLLMALINGHFDLALMLVDRGADVKLASDAGTTPLIATINTFWAPKARYPQQLAYLQQQSTYLEVMEKLLQAGADPNARLKKHIWYMEYNFAQLDVDITGATAFWRAAYAADVDAMKLLVRYGADPNIPTVKPKERRRAIFFEREPEKDQSGLPPVPDGGPGIYPIHAATGVGYGEGFAANSHRQVPDGWLPAVKYLVEELGADVNIRDFNGYNAIHHAASRGDNEVIKYLVEKGGDVKAVSRRGQTTVDMANGPAQRTQPYPATIRLLESLGAKNNHRCLSC